MIKKKIGNAEYNIIPIPPHLSPYLSRYGEISQKKPENLRETEELSKESEKIVEKLLSETVKPKPQLEHELAVFNAVINLTNQTIQDAQFFRTKQGPSATKSSTTQPRASQTTK